MADQYKVIEVVPWTYIDATGRTIDGFRTWFTIPGFTSSFYVDNPTDNGVQIKAKILDRVKNLNSLMS
jgi:hypothetical protein